MQLILFMEPKVLNQIADFFAITVEQLKNQDEGLLKDLFREWQADKLDKVHNLGYSIVR